MPLRVMLNHSALHSHNQSNQARSNHAITHMYQHATYSIISCCIVYHVTSHRTILYGVSSQRLVACHTTPFRSIAHQAAPYCIIIGPCHIVSYHVSSRDVRTHASTSKVFSQRPLGATSLLARSAAATLCF